jgi:hypothetical protein
MDNSDPKVSEDIVQSEKSSKSTDDSEWLQQKMCIEVSPEVLPHDQGLSIDTTHEEKTLSTSLVDSVGENEHSEIKILQNKPKKSMSSPVGQAGIHIFSLMD